MMARIYSSAERAIAWLGESVHESDVLLSGINDVDHHDPKCSKGEEKQYIPSHENFQKKDLFLGRPNWNRTQIIQELHMAGAVLFLCGSSQVTRTRLSTIFEDVWTNGVMTDSMSRVKYLIDGQKLFNTNDIHMIDSHLPALIKQYGRTECFDERDKVYALLSIIPENDPVRSLDIDYSITPTQLFAQIFELLKFDWPGDAWVEADALRQSLRLEWPQIRAAWNETHPKGTFPWKISR